MNLKHADYLNQEREGIFDKPEFRFDSKGRVVIPFPGKDNLTLSVTPGSKIISQSTSTYTNKPMTDPASLRTGRLYAETVIQIGNSIYLDAVKECITVGQDGPTQWIMDSEYLRGVDRDDTIFGFFLQDTKIKEGEFSKGDVLIGNYPSSYIRYDNSNRRLLIVGDLAMAGDIASTNFVTLVSGYKLEYITGNAEFNAIVVRDGVIYSSAIDGPSTIGGRIASTISGAIDSSGELITANLNTSAKTILGDFTFGVSGAIKMITDASNGLWISPTGILGKKAGVTTFAVDTSGNATYIGEVTAAQITAGTLTGFTIQTAASPAKRVVMSGDKIEIFNSSNVSVGTFQGLTGTWASAIQCTIAEIDIIGMTAQGAGFTSITKDGVIGIDIDGMAISTNKIGGGKIKLIPETGSQVYSTESINIATGKQYLINGIAIGTGTVTSVATSGAITGGTITTTGTISHSTSAGYNHIPSGGLSNQFLKYSSSGVAVWASEVYTGTVTSVATSGAISGGTITSTGTISHSTADGYIHLPSSGSTYQSLRNSSSGTAAWTSNLYVGANASYYLYLNGTVITASAGMYLNGNSVTNGTHTVVGEVYASNGSLQTTGNVYTGGYNGQAGSVNCAVVSGANGGFTFSGAGRVEVNNHFDPSGGGSYNTGGSARYWNDVSYKTLTDRGCLGWFDEGVELQNGAIVSDTEAIKAIKKHPTKLTVYGMPMIDYRSLPKVSYKPAADHDGVKFLRDKDDEPIEVKEIVDGKEVISKPQDGAEMTSIFSIMLGAIKELTLKVEKLEKKV